MSLTLAGSGVTGFSVPCAGVGGKWRYNKLLLPCARVPVNPCVKRGLSRLLNGSPPTDRDDFVDL